ncbi:signal recognition particle-docking protein FtsY [Ensifer adhaerens]|uniref:signal recognition particle-docking protein FtsY n=1 Tax=Ensifer adhaerens TaxID=106592 RepID=UPI000CF179E1|nr:signal recognition particle-docking protein FtsY [Ensifer adhaerens]
MAMGFIKRIFTFGKGAVEETKPPEGVPEEAVVSSPEVEAQPEPRAETVEPPAAVVEAEIVEEIVEESPEANFEPPVDIETLPLSDDDPVLEAEIETAGGPASDEVAGGEAIASMDSATDRHELSPAEQEALDAYGDLQETAPEEPPVEPEDLAEQEEIADAETQAIDDEASHVAATDEERAEEIVAKSDVVAETPVSEASASEAPVSEAPTVETPVTEQSALEAPVEPVAEAPAATAALPKGFAATDSRPKEEPVAAPKEKLSWYQRLRRGLARTSSQLTGQIASLFTKRKLDEATLQDLEDLLIQADLGVETAMRITDTLASERYGKDVTGEDVSRIMAGEITKVLSPVAKPLELDLSHKPHVILVVGVNGTGKTTTIGKLAAKLSGAGLKVMLAAGDTFRAAAIEQLKIWAERTKSDIVSSKLGADAAGLAYEAFQQAREKKSDVLIIDTAGRLQNKAELMAELEKIVRVLGKLDPDAPHTVLQTLDATTGQNALQQVEIFRNVAGVSGLIMTKLDGTARGGILVAISAKHKLPVYFIGVGEGIDDLEPFEAKDFAEAIAGVAA